MIRILKRLEIEWKILLLAAVVLFAFAYPLQQVYISRLKSTINQSVDPSLETLLVSLVKGQDVTDRERIAESLKRYRQWKALLPMIVEEQERAMLLLSVVLFISLLILAFLSLKKLTQPLKVLSLAAEEIGKGRNVTISCVSGGALGKLETSMNSMQNELVKLRERTRAQGMEIAWRDIARVMAHEIKNPLTPIQLTLDRIQDRIDRDTTLTHEELGKFVQRIGAQVLNLERLVNDFRSFAREPEPHLRSASLVMCVKALAGDMEGSIVTTLSGADVQVHIDTHLLGRALLNLWKNSLEAGAAHINVSIEDSRESVKMKIEDDGCGIPEDVREKVWVPYVTYKKGGTGLGLPVVKRIIESMNGTITMDSSTAEEKHGTIFTITLVAGTGITAYADDRYLGQTGQEECGLQ